MTTIIGVRFRKSGKVYYFDPTDNKINKGDHVIVETARGVEYGLVVLAPKEVTDDKVVKPLKPIIRVATPEDTAVNENNEREEKEAFKICLQKIRKHELEMKLIDSEYTFDKNKLLFYFTADGRIDFRELVKDLASVFRTRIELRQIGVRDETKMIGGIAICGRPLCCHTFLADFAPVSIKMAKEQNLSLNPAKISGVCGRLMCCLKNEEEAYEYLNSTLPNIGASVKTFDGYQGEVQSISVLKQRVKVIVSNDNDEKEVREYAVNELQFDNQFRQQGIPVGQPLPDEEIDENALKELEKLEKEDLEEAAEEETQSRTRTNKNYQNKRYSNYHRDNRSKNGNRSDNRSNNQSRREDLWENIPDDSHINKNNRYDKNRYDNQSDNRYDRGNKNFNRNTKNSWGDNEGGSDGKREYRKDYRKNRKNKQEYNRNEYKRSQDDYLFEDQDENWNGNKSHKSRYRNSHNSYKNNRSYGRR